MALPAEELEQLRNPVEDILGHVDAIRQATVHVPDIGARATLLSLMDEVSGVVETLPVVVASADTGAVPAINKEPTSEESEIERRAEMAALIREIHGVGRSVNERDQVMIERLMLSPGHAFGFKELTEGLAGSYGALQQAFMYLRRKLEVTSFAPRFFHQDRLHWYDPSVELFSLAEVAERRRVASAAGGMAVSATRGRRSRRTLDYVPDELPASRKPLPEVQPPDLDQGETMIFGSIIQIGKSTLRFPPITRTVLRALEELGGKASFNDLVLQAQTHSGRLDEDGIADMLETIADVFQSGGQVGVWNDIQAADGERMISLAGYRPNSKS